MTLTTGTRTGVASALLATLLFGVSTPLAKLLLGEVPPVLLAGLFYAGSGLGLAVVLLYRSCSPEARARIFRLRRTDTGRLAAATTCGGVLAPILLLLGLSRLGAAQTSLLLNLEGVFTVLIAWLVFHENFDRRIALGMAVIVAGGVVLAGGAPTDAGMSSGALLVVGACAC